MLLVDSNIVISLLVMGTPWHEAARALYDHDDDWRTESHALVEVSNVFSRFVRVGELTSSQAVALMNEAVQLKRPTMLTVDHVDALRLALKHKISAYDARFLLFATELRAKLVTEDAKLRKSAPGLTQSLEGARRARIAASCPAPSRKPARSATPRSAI